MTQKKRRGFLSDEEKKLWQKVTEGIVQFDNNKMATPLVRKSAYHVNKSSLMRHGFFNGQDLMNIPRDHVTGNSFPLRDADHNWHQKLRKGKVSPEGRIDLHGMTQHRAFNVLSQYIREAYNRNKRMVLVVTGKGGIKSDYSDMSPRDYTHVDRFRGTGVLKKNVPIWLSQGELSSYIVSYHGANAKDGGEGALYVVLKRHKGYKDS